MKEKYLMDVIINPEVVPPFVSHAILASIILIVTAVIIRVSIRLVPVSIQNFVEVIVEAILKLVEDNIGHRWGRHIFSFPLICTIFIFILVCNLMGLIPGFTSATQNVNTNAAMAIPVFLLTHYYGLRIHGIKYIKHFLGPIRSIAALPFMIFMFIVEFITHLARPVTLTIRLFGNMTAKHKMLIVVGILVPLVVPTMVLILGVFLSVVQAFIFALLTVFYFAGAVEEAH